MRKKVDDLGAVEGVTPASRWPELTSTRRCSPSSVCAARMTSISGTGSFGAPPRSTLERSSRFSLWRRILFAILSSASASACRPGSSSPRCMYESCSANWSINVWPRRAMLANISCCRLTDAGPGLSPLRTATHRARNSVILPPSASTTTSRLFHRGALAHRRTWFTVVWLIALRVRCETSRLLGSPLSRCNWFRRALNWSRASDAASVVMATQHATIPAGPGLGHVERVGRVRQGLSEGWLHGPAHPMVGMTDQQMGWGGVLPGSCRRLPHGADTPVRLDLSLVTRPWAPR